VATGGAPDALAVAVRGKGLVPACRRLASIVRRLGVGPHRMRRRLLRVVALAYEHGCPVTLFVPAVVLERHTGTFAGLCDDHVVLAPHGRRHIDLSQRAPASLIDELDRARRAFTALGQDARGHRSPYLRHPPASVLRDAGIEYEAGRACYWPSDVPVPATYAKELTFVAAEPASSPLLPELLDDVVFVPYCLPDDEVFVERLGLEPDEQRRTWLSMLERTLDEGGLFVLGVHPERIDLVGGALEAVLHRASAAGSTLWCTHVPEIARWWRERPPGGPSWPSPARAAFCLTGDVDAMTALDYAWRVLGR
jgi:peptidoglycan/xylan/chitin deacetylase (PgdA/CDA1 family)